MTITPAIELTQALISRQSITPDDAGCQTLIADRLSKHGCQIEHWRFADVDNVWITHGAKQPLLLLLGHTDVVTPGPIDQWSSDPFTPTIRDDYLFGRGAADMKTGVAAMVVALEEFISQQPDHPGTVALLLTSNEEGDATNGTRKVIERLTQHNVQINYCLVGEASCQAMLGDTIKIGRRGTLNGDLTIIGKQGHIAYPQYANNPIHAAMPALTELASMAWDQGDEHFDPTSLQISNIHAGNGSTNVIPGELHIQFNFRYCPIQTATQLQTKVETVLKKHDLNYKMDWHHSGEAFYTPSSPLTDATIAACQDLTGQTPTLSTRGGTSDGRFVAPTGADVIELGPVNKTIHQIDECVKLADIETLKNIYLRVLQTMLK